MVSVCLFAFGNDVDTEIGSRKRSGYSTVVASLFSISVHQKTSDLARTEGAGRNCFLHLRNSIRYCHRQDVSKQWCARFPIYLRSG